jgi:hypothetical protein
METGIKSQSSTRKLTSPSLSKMTLQVIDRSQTTGTLQRVPVSVSRPPWVKK